MKSAFTFVRGIYSKRSLSANVRPCSFFSGEKKHVLPFCSLLEITKSLLRIDRLSHLFWSLHRKQTPAGEKRRWFDFVPKNSRKNSVYGFNSFQAVQLEATGAEISLSS